MVSVLSLIFGLRIWPQNFGISSESKVCDLVLRPVSGLGPHPPSSTCAYAFSWPYGTIIEVARADAVTGLVWGVGFDHRQPDAVTGVVTGAVGRWHARGHRRIHGVRDDLWAVTGMRGCLYT